jgi:hypothetical protein
VETTEDRRGDHASFRLAGDLDVDVVIPMGEDHLVLHGTVVELADNTVSIAMDDGAAALRVAIAHHSVLVWGPEGEERCALVRSGRRVDDVHSPTTIEVVIEDVRPLADLQAAGTGATNDVGADEPTA